jgi:hypothetical protein
LIRFLLAAWALLAAGLLGCASPVATPAADRSSVWGELHLVPHEGLKPARGGGAYGDRRLAGSELVDYSQPGFAVVYRVMPDASSASGRAVRAPVPLVIRDGQVAPRIEPSHAAQRVGGAIAIQNRSAAPRVVSCPAYGLVRELAPGEDLVLSDLRSGELALFLLDVPGQKARVFVAPGPFSVVTAGGRFALEDLSPGSQRLAVWHPRFPPVSRHVDLAAGVVTRVDLELGVGLSTDSNHAGD